MYKYFVLILSFILSTTTVLITQAITTESKKSELQKIESDYVFLEDALKSFDDYAKTLNTIIGIEKHNSWSATDKASTKMALLFHAKIDQSKYLIPVLKLVELKENYKNHLFFKYDVKNTQQTIDNQTIPRKIAKKRIKAMLMGIYEKRDPSKARSLWKQIKKERVAPLLNEISFYDSVGVLSIFKDDFEPTLQKIIPPTPDIKHSDNDGTNR